jgi:hypothetical protein
VKALHPVLQGPVKVAGVAYLEGHVCITHEETPHPSRRCGTPSPQGRGIEIKITALSQGRGPDGEGQVTGLFQPHWTLTEPWPVPRRACFTGRMGIGGKDARGIGGKSGDFGFRDSREVDLAHPVARESLRHWTRGQTIAFRGGRQSDTGGPKTQGRNLDLGFSPLDPRTPHPVSVRPTVGRLFEERLHGN